MDTNGHYLAAILEVFGDSASDPARFLLTSLPSDFDSSSVWFLSPICWRHRMSTRLCQISSSNLPTSSDITDSVWNLLLFWHLKFITDSAQNLSLQIWLSGFG